MLRNVACLSWSKVAERCGYRSVGAAQTAVKRYAARNPLPSAQAAADEIVARKRHSLSIAYASLSAAFKAGDYRTVAQLVDSITRADAELARLFGIGSENVQVNVKLDQTAVEIVAAARERLMAVIDAEVVEEPKGITR
ncbi:hypothetical protein SBE55_19995 [Mycolicibacterium sp. 141076]|uniref:hypothetical protein n=1 Tax=Mycobacteriaceae TaxID=1762 RepID=UPI00299D3741|nr:hypothetical protein [Mycolicibacterium sp. 141076]MDX1880088.1 hypothetical protein [Mycolicibacterium sp. 141076]